MHTNIKTSLSLRLGHCLYFTSLSILPTLVITLLNVQLLLRGPSEYNNEMLRKLRMETPIQIELSTSH